MCQCKVCTCTPKLDLTKPVRTKANKTVRILCTDGPGDYPVIGLVEGVVGPVTWMLNGVHGNHAYSLWNLENVPPEPAKKTTTLILVRSKIDGELRIFTMWKPHYRHNWELLGTKEVTVTEGDTL